MGWDLSGLGWRSGNRCCRRRRRCCRCRCRRCRCCTTPLAFWGRSLDLDRRGGRSRLGRRLLLRLVLDLLRLDGSRLGLVWLDVLLLRDGLRLRDGLLRDMLLVLLLDVLRVLRVLRVLL